MAWPAGLCGWSSGWPTRSACGLKAPAICPLRRRRSRRRSGSWHRRARRSSGARNERELRVAHADRLLRGGGRGRILRAPKRERASDFARYLQMPEQSPRQATATNNLPLQLTTLVGREREIAEVEPVLATNRLVTLTGAGGCGKTRLALEVAARVPDAYPEGVWLVELGRLTEPSQVVRELVRVLDIREQAGRTLEEVLVAALRDRAVLLVFDNCEHL